MSTLGLPLPAIELPGHLQNLTSDKSIKLEMDNNTADNNTIDIPGIKNTEDFIMVELVLSVLGCILGVGAIILNTFFLIAVRSLKDKSTAYHRFLKNLSVADILASLTFLVIQNVPHGALGAIQPVEDFILVKGLPYVFRSTPWMFFTGYLLTLSCLTINQYVAVCRPWRYSELVTKKMVFTSLLVVWLLSFLQILVPFTILMVLYGIQDKALAMQALFHVSKIEIQVWMGAFAFFTFFNIMLDITVYKKIRKLKLKRRFSAASNNPESLNIRMKQEAFVTVTLLLLASIFCRLPFPLMGIIGLNVVTKMGSKTARIIHAVTVLLLYLNFFVDPIIYVSRMKEIRRCCKLLWAHCTHCILCCYKKPPFTNGINMRLMSTRVSEPSQHTAYEVELKSKASPESPKAVQV